MILQDITNIAVLTMAISGITCFIYQIISQYLNNKTRHKIDKEINGVIKNSKLKFINEKINES